MKLSRYTRAGSLVAVGALALTLAACGSDDPNVDAGSTGTQESGNGESMDLTGELNGGGASTQESASGAWKATFQSQYPDVTVNYDPVGSGGGREGLLSGAYDFAGSDAFLDDDELASATEVCGEGGAVEFPVYISPIAITFNLPGVDSLNMSAETIANVFAGKITKWNDEAIAKDNPDADLPDTAITPVHRSDDSGTTENFTDYLHGAAGDVWTDEADGVWPLKGGESAQGTSGVIQTTQAGEGSITYADASQVGELGTVSVGVGDEFVAYSPEAAAAVVDASPRVEGRGEHDIAIQIDRATDDSGNYPVVLASYAIACSTYADQAKADLVKGYLSYVVSEEGQQTAASAAGNAPISDTLRTDAQAAIDSITVG